MSNEIRLDGQVAVVTGAGRGLGREHALLLAARGAAVVVNDMAVDGSSPADDVVAEIREAGGTAVANHTPVGTLEAGEEIVAQATEEFGRLDVLVNNAGLLRDMSMAKLTVADTDLVLKVHLGGTIWTTKAAWATFVEQGHGRVVNTTSAAGIFGNFGQTNYAAAKAGIIGVTRTLAVEGARKGIHVNAIEPGARTRMTENLLGDLAEHVDPALVAPLVVWLAAHDCTSNGEVYNVGGGRVARVVTAQTPGLFSRELTPEVLRDGWDEVNDLDRAQVVPGFVEELEILRDFLAGSTV
ncbi:SDR family NAD(P)-dependent oxidoreductase [Nocardioides campestrisoli]|uniref:SDR family NAD(P)-dependent oxidoreductase n=1 Tax=Nocardioides campestrisoli TaxID=2736757 RepID=UPI00163DA806|nr:SDR family NAD(P)-dependent oxidoreductase [Nocardioides campestrisoli]